MVRNPILWSDYPDLDPIRVGDTYYMVSTTMFFLPGCTILRSYDLLHWEIAVNVMDRLDDTPEELLDGGHAYGRGMWAASLRYHEGRFRLIFICNETHKTYLYTAEQIEGPWEKRTIEGFYHDCSLLFDDDGRVYLVHGNTEIRLTELKPDLTGPLPGGRDRVIVRDETPHWLGYEGSHFYKIDGRYYLFLIHMPKDGPVSRTNACFRADSLDDEFIGGEVFADDLGYHQSGAAQGGIVDTPDGRWYMTLFQDHGAVGRIPVLVPMHWENGLPVCGEDGRAPLELNLPSNRPGYAYTPLAGDDDFEGDRPSGFWQWNHTPDDGLWSMTDRPGTYRITTGRRDPNLLFAKNTLTMRTFGPECTGEVTLDGSGMKDGDVAGLAAFMSCYAFIGLRRTGEVFELIMASPDPEAGGPEMFTPKRWINEEKPQILARIPSEPVVRLRMHGVFRDNSDEERDWAEFAYEKDGRWIPFGVRQKLVYRLDLFTGCRFALFCYSEKEPGGYADFLHFRLRMPINK